MENTLINALKSIFVNTKEAVQENNKTRLEDAKSKLQSLQMALDVQYRTISAEWNRENNALYNRPAQERMFFFKNLQLIKRRMNLLGQYKSAVDKSVGTIAAAQDQIEFSEKLKDASLSPAFVQSLQQSLIETQQRVNKGLNEMNATSTLLDTQLEVLEGRAGQSISSADERKAQELFDRYDTCKAAGDEKGAQAAKEAIDALQIANEKAINDSLAG